MLLGLALFGCRGVDPAPVELDELIHYMWANLDEGTPEIHHEATVNLHAALGADTFVDAFDGTVTPLSREAVARVDNDDEDPALAAGVYMANIIDCPLSAVETIVVHPDQDALYPNTYDAYARTYEGDHAAWADGSVDTIAFRVNYTGSALGGTYHAESDARLRRIRPLEDPDDSPFGRLVQFRSHFPSPAEFEGNSDKAFRQDYQMELYWERSPGEVVHLYAMWREANWGAGFTSDDEAVQRILLNALVDWDETTEELCVDGIPTPRGSR